MKKYVSVLMMILLCLLCTAAAAAPSVTDGETTGWIAENNYLFLQSPSGTVAQLSMEIGDLIRITEDELVCLARNGQMIAVKKNAERPDGFGESRRRGDLRCLDLLCRQDRPVFLRPSRESGDG